ncbi:Protein NIM1-INTERACTING [Trema orientale]|uniref:Protein NIM1-INTERACTING n=1 Tax=Trema orientale TaxID=63057 RepID=A0A2P5FDS8_TREOI|nr:Protein NIM1-INTERACTING [Trema orientale]
MESGKRKRRDDGEVNGKRRKSEEEVEGVGTTAVTEDEVEEFFAILRRIHVAANYFKNKDGAGRKLTAEGWRKLVKCETDDFDGDDGVKDETKSTEEDEDSAESSTGLDLNLEPPSKEL